MQGTYRTSVVIFAFLLSDAFGYKIVDGNEARVNSRPYMVFLLIQRPNKTVMCGGSLIRQDVVLTAAHCNGDHIEAFVGIHSVQQAVYARRGINVSLPHHSHPNYNNITFENDIMLLKLSQNVANARLIQYAQINTPVAVNNPCSVAGWGRTNETAPVSDVLREVQVTVLGVYNQTINARGAGRRGACRGDSGGPLICNGVNIVVGVVSYGLPGNCDDPRRANVYTKVSAYSQWITQTMGTMLR